MSRILVVLLLLSQSVHAHDLNLDKPYMKTMCDTEQGHKAYVQKFNMEMVFWGFAEDYADRNYYVWRNPNTEDWIIVYKDSRMEDKRCYVFSGGTSLVGDNIPYKKDR